MTHERARVLRLSASLTAAVSAFWILKPLKKTLLLGHYDAAGLALGARVLEAAEVELLAKLVSLLVVCGAAYGFERASRRLHRSGVVTVACLLFIAALGVLASAGDALGAAGIWSLYALGDLYGTLMVACLFVCASELLTAEQAARRYASLGLGAVLGGVLGSQLLASLVTTSSPRAFLLLCMALTALVGWLARRADTGASPAPAQPLATPAAPATRDASYVGLLAAIVGLYEVLSALLDFQFTATLARALDGAAMKHQIGHAFALMNATALCMQLFVTGALLRRVGVSGALLLLPATLCCASFGMLLSPSLLLASLLPSLDGGIAYSVQQTARESLYLALGRDARYRAKALVDMVLLRFAKAAAVLLTLGISLLATSEDTVRWLSVAALALLLPWTLCAVRLGRRFEAHALRVS